MIRQSFAFLTVFDTFWRWLQVNASVYCSDLENSSQKVAVTTLWVREQKFFFSDIERVPYFIFEETKIVMKFCCLGLNHKGSNWQKNGMI